MSAPLSPAATEPVAPGEPDDAELAPIEEPEGAATEEERDGEPREKARPAKPPKEKKPRQGKDRDPNKPRGKPGPKPKNKPGRKPAIEREPSPLPEDADAEGVIRCICAFDHDDGYTIQCDGCGVWQHIDCVGLTEETMPKDDEKYFCEVCEPRILDVQRAQTLQLQRREALGKQGKADKIDKEKLKSPGPKPGRKPGPKPGMAREKEVFAPAPTKPLPSLPVPVRSKPRRVSNQGSQSGPAEDYAALSMSYGYLGPNDPPLFAADECVQDLCRAASSYFAKHHKVAPKPVAGWSRARVRKGRISYLPLSVLPTSHTAVTVRPIPLPDQDQDLQSDSDSEHEIVGLPHAGNQGRRTRGQTKEGERALSAHLSTPYGVFAASEIPESRYICEIKGTVVPHPRQKKGAAAKEKDKNRIYPRPFLFPHPHLHHAVDCANESDPTGRYLRWACRPGGGNAELRTIATDRLQTRGWTDPDEHEARRVRLVCVATRQIHDGEEILLELPAVRPSGKQFVGYPCSCPDDDSGCLVAKLEEERNGGKRVEIPLRRATDSSEDTDESEGERRRRLRTEAEETRKKEKAERKEERRRLRREMEEIRAKEAEARELAAKREPTPPPAPKPRDPALPPPVKPTKKWVSTYVPPPPPEEPKPEPVVVKKLTLKDFVKLKKEGLETPSTPTAPMPETKSIASNIFEAIAAKAEEVAVSLQSASTGNGGKFPVPPLPLRSSSVSDGRFPLPTAPVVADGRFPLPLSPIASSAPADGKFPTLMDGKFPTPAAPSSSGPLRFPTPNIDRFPTSGDRFPVPTLSIPTPRRGHSPNRTPPHVTALQSVASPIADLKSVSFGTPTAAMQTPAPAASPFQQISPKEKEQPEQGELVQPTAESASAANTPAGPRKPAIQIRVANPAAAMAGKRSRSASSGGSSPRSRSRSGSRDAKMRRTDSGNFPVGGNQDRAMAPEAQRGPTYRDYRDYRPPAQPSQSAGGYEQRAPPTYPPRDPLPLREPPRGDYYPQGGSSWRGDSREPAPAPRDYRAPPPPAVYTDYRGPAGPPASNWSAPPRSAPYDSRGPPPMPPPVSRGSWDDQRRPVYPERDRGDRHYEPGPPAAGPPPPVNREAPARDWAPPPPPRDAPLYRTYDPRNPRYDRGPNSDTRYVPAPRDPRPRDGWDHAPAPRDDRIPLPPPRDDKRDYPPQAMPRDPRDMRDPRHPPPPPARAWDERDRDPRYGVPPPPRR